MTITNEDLYLTLNETGGNGSSSGWMLLAVIGSAVAGSALGAALHGLLWWLVVMD